MTELTVIDAAPPDPGVIEALEETLAEARAGKVSAVAIAILYRDAMTSARWSRTMFVSALLGAIARLNHRLNAEIDQ